MVSARLWVLALAVLALTPAILEGVTRFAFSRISALESRVATEHSAALQVRQTSVHPSVLFVGNSLLLDDVDFPELRRLLPQPTESQSRWKQPGFWTGNTEHAGCLPMGRGRTFWFSYLIRQTSR